MLRNVQWYDQSYQRFGMSRDAYWYRVTDVSGCHATYIGRVTDVSGCHATYIGIELWTFRESRNVYWYGQSYGRFGMSCDVYW
jgi:hypothetical protein